MEFYGKVNEQGVLLVTNRGAMNESMRHFAGKDVLIKIEERKVHRSNPQNKYYHGVCVPLIRDGLIALGHRLTRTEVHEFLKMRFLKKDIVDPDGLVLGEITGSTALLSTKEFNDYLEQVRQFASEYLNVMIPDPGIQTSINFSTN